MVCASDLDVRGAAGCGCDGGLLALVGDGLGDDGGVCAICNNSNA